VTTAWWWRRAAASGSEQVKVQGQLVANSLGKGGSLRIKAGNIAIDGAGNGITNSKDADLSFGAGFFSQGGFQSFDLDGRNSLTLTGGTTVAPTLSVWQATAAGRNAATGTKVSEHMVVDLRADTVRKPVSITLASSGTDTGAGVLKLQTGSAIEPAVVLRHVNGAS